jgi:hypothetical protein
MMEKLMWPEEVEMFGFALFGGLCLLTAFEVYLFSRKFFDW